MRPCRSLALGLLTLPVLLGGLLALPAPARAAQAWEVTTYGNGDLLTSAFQGIALFASEGLPSALKIAALAALLVSLFTAVGSVLGGPRSLLAIPHTALAAGIVAVLSSVHVPVAVIDKVAQSAEIVAGVPFPIAVVGYASTAFGERLAEKVEQAIYPVDFYGKFTQSGLGWGPRVMQSTLNATLIDTGLAGDLDAYVRLCVIPDIESGYLTVDRVMKATTVDEMIGDTNPAIPVLLPSQCTTQGLPQGCTPPPDDQRCPTAFATSITPRLQQAVTDPGFLKMMALQIGKPNYQEVLPTITTVAQQLLQVSQDGAELLKLRFVANQFLPSIQSNAALGGQSGILTAWALAEAQAQQTSSWLNIGLTLQQTLPFFHASLEFLFFGFLLFGLPLIIILPRIVPQILGSALWLQLWPLAYVMANRILYLQAEKAGLYSAQLGWGLSLASTHPLTETFEYAYAASGFPVAVGVMLLGGMIFGGSYAMTKVAQAGPWHEGAGDGTAAALGNVGYGNVSTEQRHLAPKTEMLGYESLGSPAVVETIGDSRAPVARTIAGPSGTQTVTGTGAATVFDSKSPDGFQLVVSEQGVYVHDPTFSAQTVTQEATRAGEQFATAHANSLRRGTAASLAVADRVAEATSHLHELSKGHSDEHAEGLATTISRAYSSRVEHALQQTLGTASFHRETDDLRAAGDLSFGLKAFGSGLGTQLQVVAQGSDGREKSWTLTEHQARAFNESFHSSTSRDSSWRAMHQAAERSLQSQGVTSSDDTAHAAQETFERAQSAEASARQSYDHSRETAIALTQRRDNAMVMIAWERWGYAERNGSMLDARVTEPGRTDLEHFKNEFRALRNDPSRRDELGDIAAMANARYPQGAGAIPDLTQLIAGGRDSLGPVNTASPAPGQTAALHRMALAGQQTPAMLQSPHDSSPTLQPALEVPAGGLHADVTRHLDAGDRQAKDWTRASHEGEGHVPSEQALRNTQETMRQDAEPRRLNDMNTEVGVKFWGEAGDAAKEKLGLKSRRGLLPGKDESVTDPSSPPKGGD